MKRIKEQKGITLVALIITIIVLLILAVVAIGAVQEDGIIGKAKYARDEYEKAQAKENSILQGYLDKINENSGNGGSGSVSKLVDEAGNDAQNKVLSTTTNTNVYDEYGNKIVVPAGFMIRVDESTTYADHVTEGIVIEDASGNQFVWVPVGNIYYSETEYKTINLDRYIFEEDGTPVPQGEAIIEGYFQELATSTCGNATAKDLQGFIDSAIAKGGYYLARYEAGVENGRLDISDVYDSGAPTNNWTGYEAEEGKDLKLVSKKDVQVWEYVTQNKASELSKNMYSGTTFTSDLINSYAWDTAIVFIQLFSTESDASNYSNLNKSLNSANTGVNPDKYCNIHDMSGNASEWTTETSDVDWVSSAGTGAGQTKARFTSDANRCEKNYSFRPILYIAL